MQIVYKVLVILILPFVLVQPQKKGVQRRHNFSGTVPISLAANFTLGQTDYKMIKLGYGAVGMGEYFFPTYSPTIYGFRITIGGQTIAGRDNAKSPTEFKTDIVFASSGLTAGYSFNDKVFPYIYAGVSNLWFSPKGVDGKRLINNQQGNYPRSAFTIDAEVGSRVVLSEILSTFFNVGFYFPQTDNLDDVTKGSFTDFYYSGRVGISLSLFSEHDTDNDGIKDSEDECAYDPEDYDGFQDEDGCPDYDNDGDKIPDVKDKCPNQPEDFDGFEDEDGCPDYDNDGDGILDKDDKCPNQPENYNGYEDDDGCPDILSNLKNLRDRDKDGIVDENDKCPDEAETINGFQDDDGCPDTVVEKDTTSTNEIVLDGMKLFDRNSYEIKPTAYPELDKVFEYLESDPFIKWAVESYTDNNGEPDSLKSLSQQRAISVVRYLINKGLPSFMFKIYGKGSESPIADNNNLERRMKNNRIIIKRWK